MIAVASLVVGAPQAHAAPACPISYGAADDAKPNKLYLYYPTVADATFPEYGGAGFETSPADPFDISLLSSYSGTADALRGAINDVVIDDYCEFNVKVLPTQTAPPATFPRRAVVAIGTDDNTTGRWGRADLVDSGDTVNTGFGRVWGGRYQNDGSTAPGGALEGANNTTQRWANAIGGTAAHEGGHTYGLFHETSLAPGEDSPLGRHVMPAGGSVNSEQRAGYRRHFSDESFATLAANVGLSVQTMHNWDLINPNAQTGHRFRLTFLSPQASPVMSWSYGGNRSPWNAPALTADGTQTFKGTTYNRFRLTWSDPKAWNGPTPGQVPGGEEFHVGATFSGVDFNTPDPIIITKSELLDSSGSPLDLQPRLPGYDEGDVDVDDGDFAIDFVAFQARPWRLEDVRVRELPRVLSIEAMVSGAKLVDPFGTPFEAYERARTVLRRSRTMKRGSTLPVRVARMEDERHLLDLLDEEDCDVGDSLAGPDSAACKPGWSAGLFPATTLYLTAKVVEPDAKVWDRRRRRYVRRDLESRIFYQLGGIHPDLNKNRIDDAVDIASDASEDENEDGVPDEAQRKRRR